jgi:hypothetical protein
VTCALPRSTAFAKTLIAMVAGAAVAVLLALAPPAHAAKGMEVAIQDEGVFVTGSTPFNGEQAYSLTKGLQVTRMRFNVVWRDVNKSQCDQTSKPANPVYDFSRTRNAVDVARAKGINVLLSITGPAPAWANGKKKCGDPNKPRASYYGQFVKAVVEAFKGRVDQYSIWNEPNFASWLAPIKTMGSQYRALYQKGYAAAKSVDPTAKVFMGELAPFARDKRFGQQPLAFLRQMACVNRSYRKTKSCPKLTTDGFAFHPYDFNRAPNRRFPNRDAVTIANLGSLTSALDKLKRVKRVVPRTGKRVNLYLTEYGYFATILKKKKNKKNPLLNNRVFKSKTRAKYLVKAFDIARRNKRVKSMLQFLLVQYPNAGQKGKTAYNFDTSIVGPTGTQTRSYTSLKKWATKYAANGQIKAASP